MNKEQVLTLFEYHVWATERILQQAALLNASDFEHTSIN